MHRPKTTKPLSRGFFVGAFAAKGGWRGEAGPSDLPSGYCTIVSDLSQISKSLPSWPLLKSCKNIDARKIKMIV